MTQRLILLIGETDRAEFRSALRDIYAAGEVIALEDIDAVCCRLEDGDSSIDIARLTAIVLVQSYHGRYAPVDIDRLCRLAPLTPIVSLAGSLCEGEGRTGHHAPGLLRVYWHRWSAEAQRRLFPADANQAALSLLPRIADEQDRLLVESNLPIERLNGTIGIVADQPETADYLARICGLAELRTVRLADDATDATEPLDAVIYDIARNKPEQLGCLTQLVERVSPAPVIAILGFPRHDEIEELKRNGVVDVISKPVDLQELLRRLADAIKGIGVASDF